MLLYLHYFVNLFKDFCALRNTCSSSVLCTVGRDNVTKQTVYRNKRYESNLFFELWISLEITDISEFLLPDGSALG